MTTSAIVHPLPVAIVPSSSCTQSGFLNRKLTQGTEGKRNKDRSWQTLWCQLKGSVLEFYRVSSCGGMGGCCHLCLTAPQVEGVRPKHHGEPPPKDIHPPPNLVSGLGRLVM